MGAQHRPGIADAPRPPRFRVVATASTTHREMPLAPAFLRGAVFGTGPPI